MRLKTILIVAVVAFIGIQALRFQSRGLKLQSTETALKDTVARLRASDRKVDILDKKVEKLVSDSLKLAGQVKTLENRELRGEADANGKLEQIRTSVAKKNEAIANWNEARQKLEALKVAYKKGQITLARLQDSLSTMPVFTDAEANKIYLQTVAELEMWRDSTMSVYKQLGEKKQEILDLTKEKSELEVALNVKDKETVLKDAAINDLRHDVQTQTRKASKGIIRRTFNAGKIKALSDIDSRLGEVNAPPKSNKKPQ